VVPAQGLATTHRFDDGSGFRPEAILAFAHGNTSMWAIGVSHSAHSMVRRPVSLS
jgi:hypothetical protein